MHLSGWPGQRRCAGPHYGGLLRHADAHSADRRDFHAGPPYSANLSWDNSALKSIEKAILNSDLGINPQNDGRNIRLNFPQLTEERRKELVKQIRKYAENGKVAIRNIRRDAMDAFKKMEKASEITEDDLKQMEKDLQKLTDESSKKIDELLARKEKELMEI